MPETLIYGSIIIEKSDIPYEPGKSIILKGAGSLNVEKYILKVFPAGAEREVYRIIEISGEHSLDDLCEAILSAFDFVDENISVGDYKFETKR